MNPRIRLSISPCYVRILALLLPGACVITWLISNLDAALNKAAALYWTVDSAVRYVFTFNEAGWGASALITLIAAAIVAGASCADANDYVAAKGTDPKGKYRMPSTRLVLALAGYVVAAIGFTVTLHPADGHVSIFEYVSVWIAGTALAFGTLGFAVMRDPF
ncbi:hypothetical protein [Stenotrophomonas maltophilia]